MSDIMYNDPKFRRDWREISTHDSQNIKGFFGEYRFLSNFQAGVVEFEGGFYPSSECAYQSAKVAPNKRAPFQICTSAESKRLWKRIGSIYSPEDWDVVKLYVMQKVVFDKFLRNPNLRSALLLTGDKYLEETNWWRDTFWGRDVDLGGFNRLGIILSATRAYFQSFPRQL